MYQAEMCYIDHINGLVKDRNISTDNEMEILHSYTNPSYIKVTMQMLRCMKVWT